MIHHKTEQVDELAKALAVAQGEFRVAELDGANPHFKSRYATLASIMKAAQPGLSKAGLSFIQAPSVDGKSVCVETMLLHASGQTISCVLRADARDTNAQSIGSIISYLKRYGLSSLLGIATGEDDDGEEGGQKQAAKPAQAQKAVDTGAHPGEEWQAANRKLRALMKERGVSNQEMRAVILMGFGQESSRALPACDLETIAWDIGSGPSDKDKEWDAYIRACYKDHGREKCEADAASAANSTWKRIFLDRLNAESEGGE